MHNAGRENPHENTSPFKELRLLKNTLYSWVFGLPLSSTVKLMFVVVVKLILGGLCTDPGGLRSYWLTGSHWDRGSRHAPCLSRGIQTWQLPACHMLSKVWKGQMTEPCWLLRVPAWFQYWHLELTGANKPLREAGFVKKKIINS